MSVQVVHLSRTEYRIPPNVRAVQGDDGRTIKMIIDDETLASGMTAMLCFQRPNGTEYDVAATLVLADNAFTADMTQGLTQAGNVKAQLSVTQSGKHVSTFLFYIIVQPSVSGEVTQERYSTIQDAEHAANAANLAAAAANTAAGSANTASSAANAAANAANAAAAAAMTYSGGYVYLTDLRTNKQYAMGFKVTAAGEPACEFTEVEE